MKHKTYNMKHENMQIRMAEAVLTPEEKQEMRLQLIQRMQYVPHGFFWQRLRFAAAGAVGLLLVVSGVSYAAERALPGDMLYAVKLELNERIRTWAALSEEAQAEWSVDRTTRRLEELERLMSVGALNDSLREEIATRLEQNTEEAHKAIISLKKEQIEAAADTSSRLESSLRVHERMLVRVAEERADVSSQIHVILDTVRKNAESVSEIRQEIEKEIANAAVLIEEKAATSTSPILEIEHREETGTGTTTSE